MKEIEGDQYEDFPKEINCINHHLRIIRPSEDRKKLIAKELEEKLSGPITVIGIIAANVNAKKDESILNSLYYHMSMLKVEYFGKPTYNTGSYNSFERLKSAITPARTSYKEGTGEERFDTIVYERITKEITKKI